MRFFALALLLLLCPLSHAAVIWSAAATDSINGVVVASGKAIFTSYDGTVYAADAASGAASWAYDTGGHILLAPALANDNTVATATSSGKLLLLSCATGKVQQEVQLDTPALSLAGGDGRVFLGFNDSVVAFSSNGSQLWSMPTGGTVGSIGYGSGTVYFVSAGKLWALRAANGEAAWSTPRIDSFLSKPQEYDANVYLGATDGKLYSFDYLSGNVQWTYQTGGWVMSTPVATSRAIYFGSNDGYLYSLSLSGNLNWRFKTGEAIWSQPLVHESEGRLLVVFSSNDGNVYALDSQTGQQIWSFSAYGKPGSLVENGGSFIFGTSKGKVYSLGASPVCSFVWPENGAVVGNWTVDIMGNAHSDAGLERVEVRMGTGQWTIAKGTEQWYAPIDFGGVPQGAVSLECRAIDGAGKNEIGDYSRIDLVVSENAPMQKIYVSAPPDAPSNESANISAKGGRGEELHSLMVKVGETEPALKDSPFPLVLGKTGMVQITIEKSGFEPVSFWINGRGEGGNLPLVLVAFVSLIALAYFLFGKKFLANLLPSVKK